VRFDDNCFGVAIVDGTSVGFVAFSKVGDAVVVDDVTEIDVLLCVMVLEEAPVVEDNGVVTLLSSSQTIDAINNRKITKIDTLCMTILL
jgi:hypothetical protein